jgi:hypothetical protein
MREASLQLSTAANNANNNANNNNNNDLGRLELPTQTIDTLHAASLVDVARAIQWRIVVDDDLSGAIVDDSQTPVICV